MPNQRRHEGEQKQFSELGKGARWLKTLNPHRTNTLAAPDLRHGGIINHVRA